MTRLAQFIPETLKSPPTLDSVIGLVQSVQFDEVMSAARYLKEYVVGIEIAEPLIKFMENSPALNVHNPEHRNALVKLWRSKLRFLDWADRWDEYIDTQRELKVRSALVVPTGAQSIHQSNYDDYKRALSRQRLDRQQRAVYEELVSRVEACQSRIYHTDGSWTANVPAGVKHVLDDLFHKDRLRIIEEKVARRNEGKRIAHLQHKQTWQITDEEYERRREWLRTWRAFCRKCEENIRRASSINHG